MEENSGESGDGLSLNEGGELENLSGENGKVRKGKIVHDFEPQFTRQVEKA